MKSKENQISLHRQLINFFSDTALATHGFRPTITGTDARNLKRVLNLSILDQTKIEKLMLYFLADRNYKNLGPSIARLFSATVLNSLRSKAINRNQFHKELDVYTDRYLRGVEVKKPDPEEDKAPQSMAQLIGQLTKELSLDRARAPNKTENKGRVITNPKLF